MNHKILLLMILKNGDINLIVLTASKLLYSIVDLVQCTYFQYTKVFCVMRSKYYEGSIIITI